MTTVIAVDNSEGCVRPLRRQEAVMTELGKLLSAHPHPALSRALLLTASDWRDAAYTTWVDARRVLAEAWNPSRLVRCRERLAAGEKAPAIRVVGFHLPDRAPPIFDPSDGIHRTVAARERGLRVKAKVTGFYQVKPHDFAICRGFLWRRTERGAQMIDETTVAERAALAALGVITRELLP
jgi:hypothetical protein